MNMIDLNKKPKLIIIDENGDQTIYYLENIPNYNPREHDSTEHYHFIQDYIEHCNNEKLKRKTLKASYFEMLQWLELFGHIVILDTTNYQNYHPGKIHEASILLSKEINNRQEKVLLSYYPIFSQYYKQPIETGYLISKKPNNEWKEIRNYEQLIEVIHHRYQDIEKVQRSK